MVWSLRLSPSPAQHTIIMIRRPRADAFEWSRSLSPLLPHYLVSHALPLRKLIKEKQNDQPVCVNGSKLGLLSQSYSPTGCSFYLTALDDSGVRSPNRIVARLRAAGRHALPPLHRRTLEIPNHLRILHLFRGVSSFLDPFPRPAGDGRPDTRSHVQNCESPQLP